MSDNNYRIHLTELSWKVHSTEPSAKLQLVFCLRKALVEYKAAWGYPDYYPGTITIGNICPYFWADQDKQQDYKYAKIECQHKEDYEALIEMKYINIENNISRLLPNMNKEDIAKYFNN